MGSRRAGIETTEKPLEKRALDELVLSGYAVDMLLEYVPDDGGCYLIYVKYHQGQVTRQVYNQRNKPRNFRNIERAIDWGKRMGFRSVSLYIDYDSYKI